ncbi:MAG: SagB/ThcOx family dehydrogenase [Halanaerobium sp.]
MGLKNIIKQPKGKGFYLVVILLFVILSAAALMVFGFNLLSDFSNSSTEVSNPENGEIVKLAEIEKEESQLEKLIYNRRSVRNFQNQAVSIDDISKILWSTTGVTVDGTSGPTRAAPSAGATNPLEIFLSAQNIKDLESGIYHYRPEEHQLVKKVERNQSKSLEKAALNQGAVAEAAAVIIITADYSRTTERYGDRGKKYVHIEAGHAAQNVNLMAENLDLGSADIGAFEDKEVASLLGGDDYQPLLLIPVAVP